MRKSVNTALVPKASGAYSQVLKVGDFVYISGQIGLNSNLEVEKSLESQVKTIFENTNILFDELKMHINQVVRVVVYITENVSVEAFDKLYSENFKHPFPARSIVYVKKLSHNDALVEMSFDAIDLTAYEAMQDCSDEGCDGCDVDCDEV